MKTINTTAADTKHSIRRKILGFAVLGAGALATAPAHAQALFENLLRVLRDRIPIAIGGMDTQAVAAPEYIASVLQQIINKNPNEVMDAQWMSRNMQPSDKLGSATIVIEIDSSGRVIDARLAYATGQGRALAAKAVNAVRRASPFDPPKLVEGNRPGRVTIDETFVFEQSGRWNLETAIEAARSARNISG